MYKKVSTDLNFVDREKAIEKFWEENHIFEKSMKERANSICSTTVRRQLTENRTSVMC